MSRIYVYLIIILSISSCQYFNKEQPQDVIARLDHEYLTYSDLAHLKLENYSKLDSALIVSKYIDNWATERLLMRNALKNISLKQQKQLDKLVNQYRYELFTQAYKEELTKKHLDTNIVQSDINDYYNSHQKDFKLNEDLIQLKYICLNQPYQDLKQIQQLFNKDDQQSLLQLDSLSLGFKSYFLNDSVWVKKKSVLDLLTPITTTNEKWYIKDNKNWKLEDSVGVYLVHIKKVLRRGENAPLSYVKPTIRQLLLNKRKLVHLKKIEKEILNDAINNNKLQVKL